MQSRENGSVGGGRIRLGGSASVLLVPAAEDHRFLQELHGVAFAQLDAHAALSVLLLASVEDFHFRLHRRQSAGGAIEVSPVREDWVSRWKKLQAP